MRALVAKVQRSGASLLPHKIAMLGGAERAQPLWQLLSVLSCHSLAYTMSKRSSAKKPTEPKDYDSDYDEGSSNEEGSNEEDVQVVPKPKPRAQWNLNAQIAICNEVKHYHSQNATLDFLSIKRMLKSKGHSYGVAQIRDFCRNHGFSNIDKPQAMKKLNLLLEEMVGQVERDRASAVCEEQQISPNTLATILINSQAQRAGFRSKSDTHLKKALTEGLFPTTGKQAPIAAPSAAPVAPMAVAQKAATPTTPPLLPVHSAQPSVHMDNQVELIGHAVRPGVGHISTLASYWYAREQGETPFLLLLLWCPLGSSVEMSLTPATGASKHIIKVTWTFPAFRPYVQTWPH